MVNVLVVFYSMYGHNYVMAQHAVNGARKVPSANVILRVFEAYYFILESQRDFG